MGLPIGLPEVIHHNYIAAKDMAVQIPWSIDKYHVPELWKSCKGKGVKVAVIDTGVDQQHMQNGDLAGNIVEAKDFTGSRWSYLDQHGHGTHTSGTIAGKNGTGVAPEVSLYIAKALSDDGSGDDEMLANALAWAADMGCHLANLSLGSPFASQLIGRAVDYCVSKGCLVICAAGNDGGQINYPARLGTVLSVGAVDSDGRLADFSSRGPEQDVAAPGVKILSCYKNGGYAVLSGTSMACPFTVGMFALARSSGFRFSGVADQARSWLEGVTVDVGGPGQDPLYGLGLFDPEKVLSKPAPEPATPGTTKEEVINIGPVQLVLHYPAAAGDLVSVSVRAGA